MSISLIFRDGKERRKLTAKPTGEEGALQIEDLNQLQILSRANIARETHNQTEEIAEDRNGIGNDPGDDPACHTDGNPRANSNKVSLVHAVSATENPDIDVLETNVAVDNTSTNNLDSC